ncbi:PREDICTED: integral membrane protein 2B-like [Priapulus caudatus]|uniref:Integral membrane protein 2 n=1 Tax=Priapulus caudatus TaxID=37621 RepID=A0ABM1ERS2_PRICU|nr:PREDICTED: integral membrane protein 2B-like [Priapulus caudatus]
MTIITKIAPEKKLIKEEGDFMEVELPTDKSDVSDHDDYPRGIATVTVVRRNKCYCALLLLLIILMMSLVGGIYLYKHITDKHRYRGWCGVRNTDFIGEGVGPAYFREELEIGEDYEKIDLPPTVGNTFGHVIHDFSKNISAIVDVSDHRCFIMDMTDEHIKWPSTLRELITKSMAGDYEVDAHYVEENYAIGQEIVNRSRLGYAIGTECYFYRSYKLVKVIVEKRDADENEVEEEGNLSFTFYDGLLRHIIIRGL